MTSAKSTAPRRGKSKSSPVVSAIIPVYNRSRSARRAIQSVLAQTCQVYELIVVDDGSTDDLAGSLSDIGDTRLRIITHDNNKGAAAARNTGVAEASGQYVAFLDSDDLWLPGKLELQLRFMGSNGENHRVSCTGYEIVTPYHPEGEIRHGPAILRQRDMQMGCRISPGSTLMAERSLLEEVGPMKESLRRLEDWDWLLRCTGISNIAILPDVLSRIDYRLPKGINYEDVRASVDLMKSEHFVGPGILPSIARLRYLAALENELAAAAYKNSRFALATRHFLKSLFHFPFRSVDTLRRLVFGVLLDIFASMPGIGKNPARK